jgi:hypothetical protein
MCRYGTEKGGRAATFITSPLTETGELRHISFLSQQNQDKAGTQSHRGRDLLTRTACCLYNERRKFWTQKHSCLIPLKVTNTWIGFMAGHKAVQILHAILFPFVTLREYVRALSVDLDLKNVPHVLSPLQQTFCTTRLGLRSFATLRSSHYVRSARPSVRPSNRTHGTTRDALDRFSQVSLLSPPPSPIRVLRNGPTSKSCTFHPTRGNVGVSIFFPLYGSIALCWALAAFSVS